jgi:hypothetical protein
MLVQGSKHAAYIGPEDRDLGQIGVLAAPDFALCP